MSARASIRKPAILAIAAAVVLSCNFGGEPHRPHPIVGTYTVTTVLDGFGSGGPSPQVVAATGATLSGTMTVEDSVLSSSSDAILFAVRGNFTGIFCATSDIQRLSGCSGLGVMTSASYPDDVLSLSTGSVFVMLFGNMPIQLMGTFFGDSITGHVIWSVREGRDVAGFGGRFTARRSQ